MGAKVLKRVLLGAVALYCCYAAALYVFQDKLLFPGTVWKPKETLPNVPGIRLVDLPFEGGKSVAFVVPPTHGTGVEPGGALIIAHGNGEIADFLPEGFVWWRNLGVTLLFVEYPGYGRAPGVPTEQSIRKAMSAAFDWLAAQPNIDRSRIAAHGISLGGGAVGLLMRDRPLAGAMLHATFTSLKEFPKQYGLPSLLLKYEMNTIDTVNSTKIPVHVIHGKHDTIIAAKHGIELAAAAKMKDFALWDCGHGCFHDDGRPLYAATESFLRKTGVIR